MTSARILRYAELEPQPWRNGLGVTRTMRAMSDGGGWALSIATLERPAVFSVIPGTQRVQLAIEAVRLVIDGTDVLLGRGEHVRFTGEQDVTGTSAADSSRVLNLMYVDDAPPLEVVVVSDTQALGWGVNAVVVLDGFLRAFGQELGPLDAVLLEPGGDAQGLAGSGELAVVRSVS